MFLFIILKKNYEKEVQYVKGGLRIYCDLR
jgi:hypothetical protein